MNRRVWVVHLLLAAGPVVAQDPPAAGTAEPPSAPRLQFSLSSYAVSEGAKKAVVTVRRTGPEEGTATVRFAVFDGTAASPSDYAPAGPVAGTLVFPPDAASRTFEIPLVDDDLPEDDEALLLRLSGFEGAIPGPDSTAVVTIEDDDPAGAFSVSPVRQRLKKTSGPARFDVRRSGGGVGAATVEYATADGSAQDGSDYTGQAGTLRFAPGERVQTLQVPLVADARPDGEEFFRLSLANPSPGATLADGSTSVAVLASSDPAVQFASLGYTAREASGQASIDVKRTGSLAQPLEVDYRASDGTAKEGVDYGATSGTLSFPPGVARRTFTVPIVRDDVFRPPRTVVLGLSGPSVGGLGTSQAELTIHDDDEAGRVEFAAADFVASGAGGAASIRISRTGNLAAGQTVELTTADGTARVGTHYRDASQSLAFGSEERVLQVTLVLLGGATAGGGARSVRLGLANPGGGADLGPRAAATLWIVPD